MLEVLPNLRKISLSPLADIEKGAERMQGRYVLSIKPNPAIFSADDWDLAGARADLERLLAQAQGCVVEIIMKDVSTLRDDPQRIWEWARMATEVTRQGTP